MGKKFFVVVLVKTWLNTYYYRKFNMLREYLEISLCVNNEGAIGPLLILVFYYSDMVHFSPSQVTSAMSTLALQVGHFSLRVM